MNLVKVDIPSIYRDRSGNPVNLPKQMALATPDTAAAIKGIEREVAALGGRLVLSDMFRSAVDQEKAFYDYKSGRKRAYSPPPGGSIHEGGRAFDLDLSALVVPLPRFWIIAAHFGVTPIIESPNPALSEAWHFECLGSHACLFGRDRAESVILDCGATVTRLGNRADLVFIQTAIVRLGQNPGAIDGHIGPKTAAAFEDATGLKYSFKSGLDAIKQTLRETFPQEYGL
jgi:D-alanyl-D-alanine dipeptidase